MIENQYLALLRGINVGGKNIIKMTDLKTFFEDMGFSDVVTYIQSGNVLFKSAEKDKIKLTKTIEKALSERFNYSSRMVIIDSEQLQKIVEQAPPVFGKEPELFKYDVVFLMSPLMPEDAIKNVKIKEGVDRAMAGQDVLYFSRLISKAGQSHLSKIISLPMYQFMTIRNWNTSSKIYKLMKRTS